jgi:thioredoxin 1
VDENPGIATQHSVFSIPTFILFVNGEPVDRLVGAVGEGTLDALIQPYTAQ